MSRTQPSSPISALGLTIWLLAALFFLYEFFLRTFVGSVAQQIIPDLHLTNSTFAALGSAYFIAYGLMQVPVGILADKFGVKIIMFFATIVCVISTFMFANAHNFAFGFTSRFLMGFGSSFAFVSLLIVASTWLPVEYFGFFAGLSQFIGTMGPLLAGGPLIAIMAETHQNWRVTLSEIGAFGLILAAAILFIVKNKPKDGKQSLIYITHSEPLKEKLLRLMKNRQAWHVALYSTYVYVPIALLGAVWGTEYLQVEGLSQGVAANIISIAWLGYGVGCPMFGALSDIAKRRKPSLIFCALLGLFSTTIITFIPLHQATWSYGILFFMLGLAASGGNIGFAAITEHTDLSTRATSLGLNNGVITIFSAGLPPIMSYLINLSSSGATTISLLHPKDFILAFSIMPIFYILSLLTAGYLVQETYCKPQKETIKLSRAAG